MIHRVCKAILFIMLLSLSSFLGWRLLMVHAKVGLKMHFSDIVLEESARVVGVVGGVGEFAPMVCAISRSSEATGVSDDLVKLFNRRRAYTGLFYPVILSAIFDSRTRDDRKAVLIYALGRMNGQNYDVAFWHESSPDSKVRKERQLRSISKWGEKWQPNERVSVCD